MHLHTGHTLEEFDLIYHYVSPQLIAYYRHSIQTTTHDSTTSHTTPHNMLCLTLYYFRQYQSHRFICDDFNMSETTFRRIVDYVIESLYTTIVPVYIIYNRHQLQSPINTNTLFISAHLIIDTTTIAIDRPEDHTICLEYFNMKSFTHHGLKFQIATDLRGNIIHVSDTVNGSVHDKTLYESSTLFPLINNTMRIIGDKGYQGCENAYTPIKKPRGRELNEGEIYYNYTIYSQRVVIENIFHRMKQYRIIGDIYRGDRDDTLLRV